MAIKTQTLAELHAFMQGLDPDLPYDTLAGVAREAGWLWRLKQTGEVYAPGRMILTFDFMIGKDISALEVLDRVTVQVPDHVTSVSMAARVMLDQTLIYLVTGRVPPSTPVSAPVSDAPPAQSIDIEDADYALPDEPEDDGALPVIVGAHTVDGVPLFDDVFTVDAPPERVVAAIFSAIEEFMPRASTVEMLNTFWKKNEREFAFIEDYGTAGDRSHLPTLFKQRQAQLATMAPSDANAPRRRAARP